MTDLTLLAHVLYLTISIVMTIWVAQTLSRNGLAFLRDSFDGNDELACSVNHLLVVGFYLLNLGYITLSIRKGGNPTTLTAVVEDVSVRVGWVFVALGVLHLFNMYVINRWRRGAIEDRRVAELDRRPPLRAEARP